MNPCGRPFSPSPTAPCGGSSGIAGRISIDDVSLAWRVALETKPAPAFVCDTATEHPKKIINGIARALSRVLWSFIKFHSPCALLACGQLGCGFAPCRAEDFHVEAGTKIRTSTAEPAGGGWTPAGWNGVDLHPGRIRNPKRYLAADGHDKASRNVGFHPQHSAASHERGAHLDRLREVHR